MAGLIDDAVQKAAYNYAAKKEAVIRQYILWHGPWGTFTEQDMPGQLEDFTTLGWRVEIKYGPAVILKHYDPWKGQHDAER